MYEQADDLRRLLNEWDYIGVFDPETNVDEYDCMLSPLLARLAGGADRNEIRSHFGMSPEPAGTGPMAERLIAWREVGDGER